jgi:hypothetical protein
MARQLTRAVSRFVAACPYVVAIHDLATKVRIELTDSYLLDLYFNATLGKYAFTLIRHNQRVLGWDNAPHHFQLANPPHHFHDEAGNIESSTLAGVPEQDILIVAEIINACLRDSA